MQEKGGSPGETSARGRYPALSCFLAVVNHGFPYLNSLGDLCGLFPSVVFLHRCLSGSFPGRLGLSDPVLSAAVSRSAALCSLVFPTLLSTLTCSTVSRSAAALRFSTNGPDGEKNVRLLLAHRPENRYQLYVSYVFLRSRVLQSMLTDSLEVADPAVLAPTSLFTLDPSLVLPTPPPLPFQCAVARHFFAPCTVRRSCNSLPFHRIRRHRLPRRGARRASRRRRARVRKKVEG